MTKTQWDAFSSFRSRFRGQVGQWQSYSEELVPFQKAAAQNDGTPDYPVETAVVYNRSLDDVRQEDDIKLIVIGDNPGKDEQRAQNRRYLVGQAGKIAEGFFRKNPELGIDFRKNTVILNKTPIHTAKTKELSFLLKNTPADVRTLFEESQRWMAHETAELQRGLGCDIWLVGYAELRDKGLFTVYRDALAAEYGHGDLFSSGKNGGDEPPLYVLQHFSMNRFSIDLKEHYDGSRTLAENIRSLGIVHRKDIFGF